MLLLAPGTLLTASWHPADELLLPSCWQPFGILLGLRWHHASTLLLWACLSL